LLALPLPLSSRNPLAQREIGRRKRNAQNLSAIQSVAMAAGSNLSKEKNHSEAIEVMRRGVYAADSFSSTQFQVPNLSDKQAAQVSRCLGFDARGQLVYYQRVP